MLAQKYLGKLSILNLHLAKISIYEFNNHTL